MNKKCIFLSFWIIYCLNSSAFADVTMDIHKFDATLFPQIKVYMSFIKDGNIVEKLDSSNFKASDDSGNVFNVNSVLMLKETDENVAIVLAVDTSGSMKDEHIIAIKKSIRALAEQMKNKDLIALISFNDDVFTNSDFTSDKELFLSKAESLKTGGKITVLFKAVFMGLDMLGRNDLPSLRYLVVLSDGKDEGIGFTLDDAIERANKINIPVYSMGFAGYKPDEKYLDNLVRLSAKTHGDFRNINNTGEIITAYQSIGDKILKQQVLKLDANFKGDGKQHHLQIQYTHDPDNIAVQKLTFDAPIFKIKVSATSDKDQSRDDEKSKKLLIIMVALCILLIVIILIFIIMKRRASKRLQEQLLQEQAKEQALAQEQAQMQTQTKMQAKIQSYDDMKNPLGLYIKAFDRTFKLKPGIFTIGYYDSNDLILNADTVSGYHAEISGNGNEWIIKDLGSTNGTRLNGTKISKASPIKKGDIIKIGSFDIDVRLEKQ